MFNHSPERDEEVLKQVTEKYKDDELIQEFLAIFKKWRAKANMRAVKIKDLENELQKIRGEPS